MKRTLNTAILIIVVLLTGSLDCNDQRASNQKLQENESVGSLMVVDTDDDLDAEEG